MTFSTCTSGGGRGGRGGEGGGGDGGDGRGGGGEDVEVGRVDGVAFFGPAPQKRMYK